VQRAQLVVEPKIAEARYLFICPAGIGRHARFRAFGIIPLRFQRLFSVFSARIPPQHTIIQMRPASLWSSFSNRPPFRIALGAVPRCSWGRSQHSAITYRAYQNYRCLGLREVGNQRPEEQNR
jgi:hypothetical protein